MSRIGLKVIEVPEKVTVTKDGNDITVKGPKDEFTRYFDPRITFEQKDGEIHFSRSSEVDKALHGTERTNPVFMTEGVTDGYVKKLILAGVGYCAVAQGKELTLNAGYSHLIVFEAPGGVTVRAPSATSIEIEGVLKQIVGRFAAEVRDVRPPEPYKGESTRYEGEYVRHKEGKTGK